MNLTDEKIVMLCEGNGVRHVDIYRGNLTPSAIKKALTLKRMSGWKTVRVIQYAWTNDYGDIGINLETGEILEFPS